MDVEFEGHRFGVQCKVVRECRIHLHVGFRLLVRERECLGVLCLRLWVFDQRAPKIVSW